MRLFYNRKKSAKTSVCFVLAAALFSCTFPASCAPKTDAGISSDSLVVLNYGKYLDETVIRMFEEETGIDVKLEEYESPEEMYTKFKAGSISYDVVCTSDYMIQRLISEGEVNEIDFSHFSYYENLDPDIIEASKIFDPESKYSMPYFYGTLGILYNPAIVSPEKVKTWKVLWDENFRDSVIMQNSVRDTFVPALRLLGYDINTENADELSGALELLIRQKPIVYAYYVDETADEMVAGNAAMALVYSGEAAYAKELNDELAYSVPEEGSNLWIDSWFIPKSCRNQENAEKFLDFLCRGDAAMLNFEYVWYGTPNLEVVAQLDEETRSDETIFPPSEVLADCKVFQQYGQETTALCSYLWKKLKSE